MPYLSSAADLPNIFSVQVLMICWHLGATEPYTEKTIGAKSLPFARFTLFTCFLIFYFSPFSRVFIGSCAM